MVKIKCQKLSGLGVASNTFSLQREFFVSSFNEISSCYNGTINICLETNLIVLKPHHRTDRIKWSDNYQPEIFDFLRVILVIPRINKEYNSWIYIPHNSLHRKTFNIHEIICERIEQIQDCEKMIIKIDSEVIQLPYNLGTLYVA